MSIWLWSALALAGPSAPAGPHGPPGPHGPGMHGPPPPVHGWIVEHADELGLDDAAVEGIRAVAEAAKDDVEAAHEEVRAAHEALRAALEVDRPDRSAVLAASARLGDAEQRARDLHLSVELELRALLTPAQWDVVMEARPMPPQRPPMPPRRP